MKNDQTKKSLAGECHDQREAVSAQGLQTLTGTFPLNHNKSSSRVKRTVTSRREQTSDLRARWAPLLLPLPWSLQTNRVSEKHTRGVRRRDAQGACQGMAHWLREAWEGGSHALCRTIGIQGSQHLASVLSYGSALTKQRFFASFHKTA
ncbi:hypothetical protein E2C01_099995 [Portunus trituberculatus]|uniref:Uncharacterized protein n=1 Tax=Portunus trituberculatus TaxID=210409 RepID=A0A5B7KIA0_PORTR|nr:hypothetical protein [Portunus trituberculatus]